MNSKAFNELLERRITLTREVLSAKGIEYSTAADKLHNFKRAAALDGETPEQALWGFLKKHLVSVMDMIDRTSRGLPPSQEWIDEKIGDCINYFILLEGLMTERLQAKQRTLSTMKMVNEKVAAKFSPIGGELTTAPGQGDPGDEQKPGEVWINDKKIEGTPPPPDKPTPPGYENIDGWGREVTRKGKPEGIPDIPRKYQDPKEYD
jgi:hypothetical protein